MILQKRQSCNKGTKKVHNDDVNATMCKWENATAQKRARYVTYQYGTWYIHNRTGNFLSKNY